MKDMLRTLIKEVIKKVTKDASQQRVYDEMKRRVDELEELLDAEWKRSGGAHTEEYEGLLRQQEELLAQMSKMMGY